MDTSTPAPLAQQSAAPARRQEAVVAFLRTAGLIEERFARLVEPMGISFQQYSVLRILLGAGEEGLATLTIAERMIDRSPGITRLVDRLEAQGLVRRVRGSDRRRVLCSITPRGLELMASLRDQANEADEAIFAALTRNEVGALVHLLQRMRATLK
jgi:DNA-binding MarR family transcriptional regulator